ncbi:unnamed protein product [Mytilus coruscus]|uniref:Glycosyltransferase 2-like domain-containing protein n=1 Tax=Mytilus coruscus TaxID=42192 RepID=A0A6J8DC87_MYTCO|nr:unnamed protein product [Mytilus coruscus]
MRNFFTMSTKDCGMHNISPVYSSRLLESLNKVDYLDDKVVIEIWIYINKDNEFDEQTYVTAKNLNFDKGHKTINIQKKHAGIYGQWIWTWQPTSDTKEICVFLEDDLSVSSFFYRYLKKVHARYDHRPEFNGFALQAASLKRRGGKGLLHASDENVVFLILF